MKTLNALAVCGALAGFSLVLSGCTNSAQNTVSAEITPAPVPQTSTIYVPQGEVLVAKPAPRKAIDTQVKLGGNAAPVLQEIISAAPDYFPKNAKINNVKRDGDVVIVDVDKNFANDQWWSSAGSTGAGVSFYAIINTASGEEKTPVKLTVEGKEVPTLGELDVSGKIEPDAQWMAKK